MFARIRQFFGNSEREKQAQRIIELESRLLGKTLLGQAQKNGRPQWFEYFDPLKGATLETLTAARDEARYGAYARQMLIWDEVLYSDGMLGMLFSRLVESVSKQSWMIEVADDSAEANEQRGKLESFYAGINGLQSAFGQLASAMFYGFAHLQLVDDQWGRRFEFVPQRYWVRSGELNSWEFNANANIGTNRGEDVSDETLIVMEVSHPIMYPATRASFERQHAKMIWDNHADRYGSAPAIITAPASMSAVAVDKLYEAAEQLKSGASIVLPSGSEAKPLAASNISENYFKARIDMADRDQVRFVMAGSLTVLSESGSGTLAGNAHMDSWNCVVQGVCGKVADAFNDVICPLVLGDGRALARLKINFETVQSPLEKAQELAALASAGVEPKKEEVESKLGVEVEEKTGVEVNRAGANTRKGLPKDAFERVQKVLDEALMKGFARND